VACAFDGVLQPINNDGSSIFKAGSTVPVKFRLKDANGEFITNAAVHIYSAKISNGISGTFMEATSSGNASSGNIFRYDSAGNQYIFNLSTKGWATGTYQLTIKFDNGDTLYTVNISCK
jgi:hypothetical protein